MKLLEENGLREKIINECIKYENKLGEIAKDYLDLAKIDLLVADKVKDYTVVDKYLFCIDNIKDLRTILMQLLDNEKVE